MSALKENEPYVAVACSCLYFITDGLSLCVVVLTFIKIMRISLAFPNSFFQYGQELSFPIIDCTLGSLRPPSSKFLAWYVSCLTLATCMQVQCNFQQLGFDQLTAWPLLIYSNMTQLQYNYKT